METLEQAFERLAMERATQFASLKTEAGMVYIVPGDMIEAVPPDMVRIDLTHFFAGMSGVGFKKFHIHGIDPEPSQDGPPTLPPHRSSEGMASYRIPLKL